MAILLDTGYLFSLNNFRDVNYKKVKTSYKNLLDGKYGIPFLLDYVFDELVTLIQCRTKRNDIATIIGNSILEDCNRHIQFARVNKINFENAWNLFQNQKGRKFLSFTDCILIKYAEYYRINKIATLDQQFNSWVKIIP